MSGTEKAHSKLQWFFFVICIPVLFAVILFSVILSFLGIDVLDKAKEYSASVRGVSTLLVEDAMEEEIVVDIAALETTIQEQQVEIERLQMAISQREEEIKSLNNEVAQIEHKAAIEEELHAGEVQELKDIAKTYESMSSKNAANIITQLATDDALLHLSQVSIEVRAGILSKMDSEKAADLLSRLANQ
jgi:flagellar motility protein MotE (MotC chaperone)